MGYYNNDFTFQKLNNIERKRDKNIDSKRLDKVKTNHTHIHTRQKQIQMEEEKQDWTKTVDYKMIDKKYYIKKHILGKGNFAETYLATKVDD